uniref:NADH-ubiquinone oxidoreductase chain 1 n=1 Tax=Gordionus wolterstorffii TaxID=190562 RepID=A0A514ABY6_9BILA|nr:NADH dehydrogenase subunit 1 [Gordionus wolterstorffii]
MVLFEVVLTQVSLLISMSFYTLLERKMLGSAQLRKGPNKVLVMGLVQPFSDALKLLTKGYFSYKFLLKHLWTVAPVLSLGLYLVLFEVVLTQVSSAQAVYLSVVILICLLGLGVYLIVIKGWVSNSKYSFLGSIRAVSQALSYELLLSFIFLLLGVLYLSFFVGDFIYNLYFMLSSISIFSFLLWVGFLAETNRSPFDLLEGESEIVSGYNVEYSAGGFTIIFMAEYMGMMFFSVLFIWLVGGTSWFLLGTILFVGGCLSLMYLLVRASYPRMRYDLLLESCWNTLFPLLMGAGVFLLLMVVM